MPKPILTTTQFLLTALVPVLLVLVSVRLMLTETWLKFEYSRLPEDVYGWDKEVRQEYGPYGIKYLLNDEDISYLADLTIDGQPAFRNKELEHMEDVKAVTQAMLWVLTISLILFLAGIMIVAYFARARLLSIFFYGGAATLITIVLLVVLVVISWDFFFDTFHAIFFAEDSWRFYRDDTLIRLYPQQFWFESALAVGILTIGGAVLCMVIPWRITPHPKSLSQRERDLDRAASINQNE